MLSAKNKYQLRISCTYLENFGKNVMAKTFFRNKSVVSVNNCQGISQQIPKAAG